MQDHIASYNSRSPFKTIITSGFVAGTLDMSTALLVYTVMMQKTTAVKIMQSIASGVFKSAAYAGGMQMAIVGLLFHYCIAFIWAFIYFFLFPYVPFLKKQKVISGILYGIVVWCIMNLVVLTLAFGKLGPFTLKSIVISAVILIFMIGTPISFITHKYYTSKPKLIH